MTCWEAIQSVFAEEAGVLTTEQVVQRIYANHPDKPWKPVTISCQLIGLSINHASSRHYPSTRQHASLFSLGNGRYRRWNPEQDGTWALTDDGVRLVDEGGDAVSAADEPQIIAAAEETSLSLERDLERSLVNNLDQLEPGLKLYSTEGVVGQQLETGVVGRLDLLAVDANGDFVVIELKAGRADDKVCGQILRYMGWVKREIAGERRVRGIVVASDFSEALKYAVQAMPDVRLKRYEVRFTFADIQ